MMGKQSHVSSLPLGAVQWTLWLLELLSWEQQMLDWQTKTQHSSCFKVHSLTRAPTVWLEIRVVMLSNSTPTEFFHFQACSCQPQLTSLEDIVKFQQFSSSSFHICISNTWKPTFMCKVNEALSFSVGSAGSALPALGSTKETKQKRTSSKQS